jgi:hypothetical protein
MATRLLKPDLGYILVTTPFGFDENVFHIKQLVVVGQTNISSNCISVFLLRLDPSIFPYGKREPSKRRSDNSFRYAEYSASRPDPFVLLTSLEGEQQLWEPEKTFENHHWSKLEVEAVIAECQNLLAYKTFDAIDPFTLSPEVQVRDTMMIVTEKIGPDGQFIKWKGRIVGRGDKTPKSPLKDNYAPTVNLGSVFITLNVAAFLDYGMDILDVTSAYLEAEEDEEIYVKFSKDVSSIFTQLQPDLEQKLNNQNQLIVKLNKSLYGFRNSARNCYRTLSAALVEFGLEPSPYDPALFFKKLSKNEIFIVNTHSDDLLSVGPDNWRERFRKFLDGKFNTNPIKIQENIQTGTLLGMVITRDRASKIITITQPNLVASILAGVEENDYSDHPYLQNFLEYDPDCPMATKDEHAWFRSILMKINFLTRSRIELKFAVAYLATKMASPSSHDIKCLQHILRYLNKTRDLGLLLRPTSLDLMASIDSSFAVHKKDATSQAGLAVSLGTNNVAAGWSHKMNQVNADSTSAELGALAYHVREVLWWINSLNELGFTQDSIPIQQDNSSTILLSRRGPGTGKSRYLNVNYFFAKQYVDDGTIDLIKVESSQMIADGFTKPLYGSSFVQFRDCVLNRTIT